MTTCDLCLKECDPYKMQGVPSFGLGEGIKEICHGCRDDMMSAAMKVERYAEKIWRPIIRKQMKLYIRARKKRAKCESS